MDVVEATIDALGAVLERAEMTSENLVEAYLARIDAYDTDGPMLASMLTLDPEALDQARQFDAERTAGRARGPLHGIPIVVKDNFDVANLPTTAGSVTLDGLVPRRDAFVVARLREAGAIILGKTNLHEFAAGITTVSSAGGATRNPYDPARNPGGSSGGTAAAVAASFAAAGMGTDTTGSIRVPAAQTSLVGLRPSQGLTSRSGIVPLSLTQDVVGPLARCTRDLARLLDVVVGYDPADPDTSEARGRIMDFTSALGTVTLKGLRLGRLDTLFGGDPADAENAAIVRTALDELADLGVSVIPIELPEIHDLLDLAFQTVIGDFPGNIAAYLAGHPSAPLRSLDEIVATGRAHPQIAPLLEAIAKMGSTRSEPYRAAIAKRQPLRTLIEIGLESQSLDALVYPTITRPPEAIGAEQPGNNAHASSNSGLPAISLPAGFTDDGLPVGLDLLGRRIADVRLVAIAHAIEQARPVRRPPDSAPPLEPQ